MNEKSGNFELLEPVSPESLVPDSLVEPWMIVAVALLVIALLVAAVIFHRKKAASINPLALRQAAHREAAAALDSIGAVSARDAAVQSSLILRRYLSVVAGDPALFETHEEFVSRHEALQNFSEAARAAANLGFTRLAAMKYSAETPAMASPRVIAESHELLKILHHGLPA